jgi:chromosomal replication initiator protein
MPATKEYWPLVLETIKNKISTSSFKAWFSRLEFVSTGNQGRKIIIAVPSAFNKQYIESKFHEELKDAIGKYYPQVIHIDYQVKQVIDESTKNTQIELPLDTAHHFSNRVEDQSEPVSLSSYLPKKSLNNLNPKYTFDNFVVTKNNELAVSVCQSIVKQPGTIYNPLFIYGSVGLGKTHLIQAIGQKMLENYPSYNIKYIASETFVNQFILAFQKRKMDEFRDYYRSVDLLLIDDIQFIAGKEATQEVFFHTFNELHQTNKQIILTSDRAPKALGGIEDRLISRFEWGMVVDISKPDLEARIAILKDKSERLGINLTTTQLNKISHSIDTNIRELEGLLNKLKAKAQISLQQNFEDSEIEQMLNQFQTQSPIKITMASSNITVDKVIDASCKLFSISKTDLIGSSREKNISLARQIAFWYCKHELEFSYPVIGKLFGNRDHSTIIHGCSKVDKLLKTDLKLQNKLQLLKEQLAQM